MSKAYSHRATAGAVTNVPAQVLHLISHLAHSALDSGHAVRRHPANADRLVWAAEYHR